MSKEPHHKQEIQRRAVRAQFLKHGKSYAFGVAFVAPQLFRNVLEEGPLIHRISVQMGL